MQEVIKIFNPEGVEISNYRDAYPDLSTIAEFNNINNDLLVFVWWYANPQSEFIRLPQEDRLKQSAYKVWKTKEEAHNFLRQYMDCVHKDLDSINIAIERMSRIRYDARFKAAQMVNRIFDDYTELLNKKANEFTKANGEVDYNGYFSIRKNILSALDDVISKVENGFGSKQKDENVLDGQELMEAYHGSKMNI